MAARSAILVLNHQPDRHLVEQYTQMRRACAPQHDVILLSDRTRPRYSLGALADAAEVQFTVRDLVGLGYPGKQDIVMPGRRQQNLKLGNAELPVLLFYAAHDHYDHYWIVEYDVRFTGPWQRFFGAFDSSSADLIGTSLIRFGEFPGWSHWRGLQVDGLPEDQRLRGFFPIYRLSNAALAALHAAYAGGVSGHMEGLVPTVLHRAGLELEDIGGDGHFVRPGNINRFYTNQRLTNDLSPGTFVYRPASPSVGAQQNMLWHPVKPPVPITVRLVNRILRAWP